MVALKRISKAVLVIFIALISFRAGGLYWQSRDNASNVLGAREVLYYIDPMTPGFRSAEPGIAPCGMPLEPVYAEMAVTQESYADGVVSLSSGAVQVNPARQQLIGVKSDPVELQPMTSTLRLYGKLVTDETRTFQINASTDSWVRNLPDITTGDIVKKNQILAEVLAPAFYNAQVTYLVSLDNVDRIMQQLGEQHRHQQADIADNQIRVAVQALQNLGITDAQIEELANSRQAQPLLQIRSPVDGVVLARDLTLYQWFKAGEEFFTIADIGRLWVYADVYEDEVRHLRPGMAVQVQHGPTGQTFDAEVSKVLPLFDNVAKTLKVRIDIDNPRYELRPEMFVDIEIPISLPPTLYVPTDAVIDSGTRKIVYVHTGSGIFEPREITTGWKLGRHIEIAGGLMPGEKVVVAGNFLLDSESRMKTASSDIARAATNNTVPSIDPVCGMDVDQEKAKLAGRTSIHVNRTIYFCRDECKTAFDKDPEKYARKNQPPEKPGDHQVNHAAMADTRESWLEMLEAFTLSRSEEETISHPGKEQQDAPLHLGAPTVIDWSGEDKYGNKIPPREWRKGWGTFPGAEYLGQKNNIEKTSARREEVQEEEEEINDHPGAGHGATDESSAPLPMRRIQRYQ